MQAMVNLPKVQVLLSAYNGEKYIREQIQSILMQENVDVHILIRDDGSTDETRNILKEICEENRERVQVIEGENIGYRKSFLSMLANSRNDVEYFSFSDQDDVWDQRKLERAIELLRKNPESWLYASALKITDENLNLLSEKQTTDLKQSLGSFFVRTRLAGCTMVFTRELKKLAEKYSRLDVSREMAPDHDGLLCMLSLLYNKNIVLDDKAYILHRRHKGTETSGGRGVMNRIQVELKRILKRTGSYKYIASLLLNEPILQLEEEKENRKLLNDIAHYDKSVRSVIKLCFNSKICCGIKMADILIRCKILLMKY